MKIFNWFPANCWNDQLWKNCESGAFIKYSGSCNIDQETGRWWNKNPITQQNIKGNEGYLVKTTMTEDWHKEMLKAKPPNNKNIGSTLSFLVQKNIKKWSVPNFWRVLPLFLNVILKARASIKFKLVQNQSMQNSTFSLSMQWVRIYTPQNTSAPMLRFY